MCVRATGFRDFIRSQAGCHHVSTSSEMMNFGYWFYPLHFFRPNVFVFYSQLFVSDI